MSQYLPVSTQQAGLDLSEALWTLARPVEIRQPGEITRFYCGAVEDVNGQWYLDLPDHLPLSISPRVTEAQLSAVVSHIETQEDRLP